MSNLDKSEKPGRKSLAFTILHFFVVGSAGDFDARTGKPEQFSRTQMARLKFLRGLLTTVHIALIRISGGRLGTRFMGMSVLVLTTIGRKSGKPRSLPLFYLQEGPLILVVGSNGGAPSDPLWLLNGLANPRVSVLVNGRSQQMRLRLLTAGEKAIHWPRLTEMFPKWNRIEERSKRSLPVAVLEPLPGD